MSTAMVLKIVAQALGHEQKRAEEEHRLAEQGETLLE